MSEYRQDDHGAAGAPHAGPAKVTTYSAGHVPGVSYKGGYAHSPRDDEGAEIQDNPASGHQHGASGRRSGTRVMPPEQRAPSPPPPSEPPPRKRQTSERPPKRRRSGFGRFLRWFLAFLLVILVALVALGWFAWSKIEKVDAIPDDHGSAVSDGRVFLVVGSDSREGLSEEEQSELGTGDAGGQRADTIMLLHVPSSGRAALVSIPRDSVVDIPGEGSGRVNAAFAYGGASLLVETLEANTGVAIDDYVQIGFGGFANLVDALGGVEMCLDEAIQDEKAHIDLPAGCQELGGTDALGYARARYSDPRGDLGRVERQRELVSAIVDKTTSPGTLLNPIELTQASLAGGDVLILDEGTGPLDMFSFIRAVGSVSSGSGDTLTVPVGSASNTVSWDQQAAGELWTALQNGTSVPGRLLEDQE